MFSDSIIPMSLTCFKSLAMATKTRSVQFRTVDEVIEAYENLGIADFAVWCDNVMQFPYEPETLELGIAYLEQLLETVKRNSAAIYTLKIYKDVPPGGLTDKTPYRAAFNFQLKRQGEDGTMTYVPGGGGVQGELLGAVTELTQVVRDLKDARTTLPAGDDDGEDEQADDGLGFLGKVMNHPVMGPIAGDLFRRISGAPAQLGGPPQQGATMAGVPGAQLSAEQEGKVNKALAALRKLDPDLGDHLLKLSIYAETNAPGYTHLVGMLNML